MKAERFVMRQQSLDEFFTENEKDFRRMAAYILGRWKAPNDVGVEDVMQELRIAIWRKARKYDPKRGKKPEQFLAFNAISLAKRQVHKQRRARGDKGIGHIELLTNNGIVVDTSAVEPEQEFSLAQKQELALILDRCTSTREAICLAVFFKEKDAQAAARRIFEDDELRRLCRVSSMSAAKQAVRQTVEEHACRG